ncbi:hypothetical protein V8F20_005803 [Naviculisporaceae sp. PSN 640]
MYTRHLMISIRQLCGFGNDSHLPDWQGLVADALDRRLARWLHSFPSGNNPHWKTSIALHSVLFVPLDSTGGARLDWIGGKWRFLFCVTVVLGSLINSFGQPFSFGGIFEKRIPSRSFGLGEEFGIFVTYILNQGSGRLRQNFSSGGYLDLGAMWSQSAIMNIQHLLVQLRLYARCEQATCSSPSCRHRRWYIQALVEEKFLSSRHRNTAYLGSCATIRRILLYKGAFPAVGGWWRTSQRVFFLLSRLSGSSIYQLPGATSVICTDPENQLEFSQRTTCQHQCSPACQPARCKHG